MNVEKPNLRGKWDYSVEIIIPDEPEFMIDAWRWELWDMETERVLLDCTWTEENPTETLKSICEAHNG